ncbi:hypothetical protein ACH5RR_024005 [Cinchona calisaya]|uniref:Cytochrome P450 87A3 n=1 Tax=Cinchona calisaya TaxID=153742 RepID=A0ABD2ZDE4_9GENT
MFPTILCLVALVLVGISQWIYRWRNPRCNGVLPPGSMGFPIIGESMQFFSSQPLDGVPSFIQKRVERYGSLFRTSVVGQPMVVSTDAEINHYIFQQEGKLFQCWYTESARQITGKQGIMVQSGVMHKYLRNLALSLIGPEKLKDGRLLHEMNEITRNHLHMWNGCGGEVEVKEAIATMVFQLAAKVLLCCTGEMALKLRRDYKDFFNGLISFPFNIPGTTFHSALKGRRNALKVIKDTFNKRRSTKKSHDQEADFLDCLLEELDKKETPLTEDIALDLVFLLLFAAFETSSSAITLALKFLNHHPEALKELREEHERIPSNRQNQEMGVTWTEYKSMTFTHMGQELHAGSKKFMAFGGGSRLCAGADFAKLQMAIFLHHLVTNYRWKVVKEGNIIRQPGLKFVKGFHIRMWDNGMDEGTDIIA